MKEKRLHFQLLVYLLRLNDDNNYGGKKFNSKFYSGKRRAEMMTKKNN